MRITLKVLFIAMSIGLLTIQPVLSYADWNSQHNGNSHSGGSNARHSGNSYNGNWHGHDRSFAGIGLSIWPNSYYYGAPYYPPTDAVLVSSPVYQPVLIDGVTYYLNDGTYYVYNGYNYQPVAPPVTVVEQPQEVVQPPAPVPQAAPAAVIAPTADIGGLDSITINIPNNKGSYTPVTLKKSGNGYTGPQGEFYTEFPKVAQLEIMYGK